MKAKILMLGFFLMILAGLLRPVAPSSVLAQERRVQKGQITDAFAQGEAGAVYRHAMLVCLSCLGIR